MSKSSNTKSHFSIMNLNVIYVIVLVALVVLIGLSGFFGFGQAMHMHMDSAVKAIDSSILKTDVSDTNWESAYGGPLGTLMPDKIVSHTSSK